MAGDPLDLGFPGQAAPGFGGGTTGPAGRKGTATGAFPGSVRLGAARGPHRMRDRQREGPGGPAHDPGASPQDSPAPGRLQEPGFKGKGGSLGQFEGNPPAF